MPRYSRFLYAMIIDRIRIVMTLGIYISRHNKMSMCVT